MFAVTTTNTNVPMREKYVVVWYSFSYGLCTVVIFMSGYEAGQRYRRKKFGWRELEDSS